MGEPAAVDELELPRGAVATIGAAVRSVFDRLVRREPILVFGTIGLWITAGADVDPTSAVGVALASTVLLFQRAFSTAKATAEENVAAAQYVGAIEHQAVTEAAKALEAKAEVARAGRRR